MPTSTKVGSVSRARYEEIIVVDRKLIEVDTKIQFNIGDHALDLDPMRPHGGSLPAAGEELLGVQETLELYAEDIGGPYNQVRLNRQTAGKWPAEHRIAGVSFEIHRILEKLDDRFDRIQNPPRHPRDGVPRWTQDAVKRQVGWRVDNPQTKWASLGRYRGGVDRSCRVQGSGGGGAHGPDRVGRPVHAR